MGPGSLFRSCGCDDTSGATTRVITRYISCYYMRGKSLPVPNFTMNSTTSSPNHSETIPGDLPTGYLSHHLCTFPDYSCEGLLRPPRYTARLLVVSKLIRLAASGLSSQELNKVGAQPIAAGMEHFASCRVHTPAACPSVDCAFVDSSVMLASLVLPACWNNMSRTNASVPWLTYGGV